MEAKSTYMPEYSYSSEGKIKNGIFYDIGIGIEHKNYLSDLS